MIIIMIIIINELGRFMFYLYVQVWYACSVYVVVECSVFLCLCDVCIIGELNDVVESFLHTWWMHS